MPPQFLSDSLAATFRRQLSEVYRVPAASIHLLESADAAIRGIAGRHAGPLITFPPAATANLIAEYVPGSDIVSIARGVACDAVIGPDVAADMPRNGLAVIDSPSNPLGSILSPADAVRLSRACTAVVVDERFAEFSEFSLLPLALELDNVVVIRSFESWSGLPEAACAWAVAPPRLAHLFEQLAARGRTRGGSRGTGHIARSSVCSGDDEAGSRRTVPALSPSTPASFLEPLPSWAPFVAARVAIVPRQDLIECLAKRGIRVHAPPEPGLENYVRIGIGSRTAMDHLRTALLELGPELVG